MLFVGQHGSPGFTAVVSSVSE